MRDLKGRSVLITGGAGFIGSHVTDMVAREDPSNLVVADNLYLGKEENLEDAKKTYPKLKFYKHDITDHDATKKLIEDEKIDVVFNLAVIPLPASLVEPLWTFEHNIQMAQVMCDLLEKGHYKTLIHFSTSESYGSEDVGAMKEDHPLDPLTPYAASKAAADHLVMSYYHSFGLDVSIIRPFNNYGPRQNDEKYAAIIPVTIKRMMQGKPPIINGDGLQTRDFIYVEDTAKACIDIYKNEDSIGKIINVASGEETSILSIVDKIKELLGSDIKTEYRKERVADVRRHMADITRAKELLGFRQEILFEDGMKKTVDWYKKRYS